MNTVEEQKNKFYQMLDELHNKNCLSKTVGEDYFEPGKMEYLEQWDASYDKDNGEIMLRFEAKGTRYDGRSEQIEKVKSGDVIQVVREKTNLYNPNNYT